MKLTVIGIGQTLRGDDAAGIEAVRRWELSSPHALRRSEITVQYDELPGLRLLDMLDGFDAAVIVDALEGSGNPGQIFRLSPGELAAFTSGSKSAHGWGVAETLELGRQANSGHRQPQIRLVGIATAQMELGQPMSTVVRNSLNAAAAAIEEEVRTLLG